MVSDGVDDFDEINNTLYSQGATDGLPVVPPTEDLVEEMLRGTDLPRDHEIGKLGNREGSLTIEKLATNAVMAGCRPIHMPVLIAGSRALVDPESNTIQSSVSTGSWAYLWVLNGPVRESLDIQSTTNAFGPGYRGNGTIGRALGLAYKNAAQLLPGEKDMGVLGSPFKFSLVAGENEEQSPWEPYHVTAGYDEEESTITFGAPNSYAYANPFEMDTKGILRGLVKNTPPSMVGYEGKSVKKEVFYFLPPYNAEELSDAGMNKDDVKEYIYENAILPDYKHHSGIISADIEYDEHDIHVSQFQDPDRINVLTIGGSARTNAIIGPSIGGPVTKKIETPDNWETLLEEYTVNRDWGEEKDHYELS